jgi:hypothetical protein
MAARREGRRASKLDATAVAAMNAAHGIES